MMTIVARLLATIVLSIVALYLGVFWIEPLLGLGLGQTKELAVVHGTLYLLLGGVITVTVNCISLPIREKRTSVSESSSAHG